MSHLRDRLTKIGGPRLKLTSLVLQRGDGIRRLKRLFLNFAQPRLQTLLELLQGALDQIRLCHPFRQSRDQLRFQPVLPDHQPIGADTPVTVVWAPVLDIGTLPRACNDHHFATANTAYQETTENVPSAPCGRVKSPHLARREPLAGKTLPRLRPLPKIVGDDSPLRDVHPLPIALRSRTARFAARLGVALLLSSVPDKNPSVSFIL